MALALEVRDLHRRFGNTKALQGLSFSVPASSVTALVGANGAGKTTTFSVVGGFLRPERGEVIIGDEPMHQYRAAGGIIGLLPQDMQYFEDRTIYRQLVLFAKLAGMSSAAAGCEVERVLNLTRLSDRGEELAGGLSHGMRVRLGVAQALIGTPPLVLLDEPTAGLDPRMVVEFRHLIADLRGKTTLVISSHNLSELEEICDYVCIVDRGQLVKQGPLHQVVCGDRSLRIAFVLGRKPPNLEQLASQIPGGKIHVEDDLHFTVEVDLSQAPAAEVNRIVLRWLLDNGVPIFEVRQHRNLEQAFLRATERSEE